MAELSEFRQWLADGGINRKSVSCYATSVQRYLKAGGSFESEEIERYFSRLEMEGTKARMNSARAGISAYIRYMRGDKTARKRKKPKATCNEDCFNCIYDDCIMP